jgi:predicted O-linked N-acetylglucosamine transferase (SPINDLY family)
MSIRPAIERHKPVQVAESFQQAVRLHAAGHLYQADALCAQLLKASPRHAGALNLRGLIATAAGELDEGIRCFERAAKAEPLQPVVHCNLGNALLSGGNAVRALASLDRAIQLRPDYFEAHYNRANALRALGRNSEALVGYERAVQLRPEHAGALNNYGLLLLDLNRGPEAVASLERAHALSAEFEGNLAAALHRAGRLEEAQRHYQSLLQRAPQEQEALLGLAKVQLEAGQGAAAVASLERLLQLNAAHVGALILSGDARRFLAQPAAAMLDYEHALQLAPDSILALNNYGNMLLELGQAGTALEHYDRALSLAPREPDTQYNRAAALRELGRREEAAGCLEVLLREFPGQEHALTNLFHVRMDCCNWTDFEDTKRQLWAACAASKRIINPMSMLMSDSPQLQFECAQSYVAGKYGTVTAVNPRRPTRQRPDRIRVAYVSGDFREHPVAYLLAGVLEHHDRARIELIGVSLRSADRSAQGQRVRAACGQFIEAADLSDLEVARQLQALGTDVAVDLMGLTQGQRLGIFAQRAAPVQVSYLGYAATSGAPFMDYLIADEIVIPESQERWYSERIVRLPHCYLPTDDRRPIGEIPTRAQAGLPPEGLVCCAFTNPYKITPPVFNVWIGLLARLEDSVLWLRDMGEEVRHNLLREAAQRGISAHRLVFAPHVASMAEHLARHSLADLYLDTLPYNAHSTACDALWAGVPVITCAGHSFASNVAASALTAVGLQELVVADLEQYAQLAWELGRDRARLSALRARLARQRISEPLFATAAYTGALERAYLHMHQLWLRGQVPQSFRVSPMAAEPAEH